MHLSYTSAQTLSYSTASTQTPPELNLPEDDLQIGKTWARTYFYSEHGGVYNIYVLSLILVFVFILYIIKWCLN